MTEEFEPALVPELLVTDIDRSIEFWCGICGFELRYSRPEERFAYIALGTAHVMLEQFGIGRNWVTSKLEASSVAVSTFRSPFPTLTQL